MPPSNLPTMHAPQRASGSWTVLPSWLPVGDQGFLVVNAFVLEGPEPMLVDTGIGALHSAFVESLESVIDPAGLRWIWLSHMDPDHVGNLDAVLERAPRAMVLTNFLGMGKMALAGRDTSRVRLLEPGQPVDIGGRRIHPLRPLYYDAPETLGFYDAGDDVLFAADSFGALLDEPVERIDAVARDALQGGMAAWMAIDAPWLADVERGSVLGALSAIKELDPAAVLSAHLPSATGRARELADIAHLAIRDSAGTKADPICMENVIASLAPEASAAA